jgi:putative transposase
MPNYRRNYYGEYFCFTLVTQKRIKIFNESFARNLLHSAITKTRNEYPWEMTAIVLMPEHLHMLWRMPANDTNYSMRIGLIKRRFTKAYLEHGGKESAILDGQAKHRRRGVWQQRFWEHTIKDARDFHKHLDYIHLNPVNHGLVDMPIKWQWSSFHEYVKNGCYESDWCGMTDLPENIEYFMPE